MSEAVLDHAVENIADGLSVDWGVLARGAQGTDDRLAKCLRIISDVANLHRADAVNLLTEMPTAPVLSPVVGGVPETWGKYKLADRVGAGSYGAVYRAWDSDLERDVAIKILHARFGDTRLKENLLSEGRALAKIRHDNVVRVLGVESHDDRVALCMEFVKGQTLDDVVRRQGTLRAREAIAVGEDLCRAVAAVHRAGYLHRDIKAKNVMRDDTGRIVLMDFGTGRLADGPVGRGDRAGTPLYMAPEVIDNAPASPASDVYSLGVLLYHLVTGDYPVDARTIDQLQEAHANRRHRWLSERRPDLPVAFMQVVERAIALDPADRYENPSELLAALAGLKLGVELPLRRVAVPAIAVSFVFLGMVALGALTSFHYNTALQRSGFADEGVWDWLRWGRLTSVPTFIILVMVLLAGMLFVGFRRFVLATSGVARRWDHAIRQRATRAIHRARLDEASVLASVVILISATALAAAWWYFSPLILALLTYLPTASAADFSLLSPDLKTYHNYYRGVFSFVVILSVVLWYPVVKLVRKGQSLHWGMWLAGGVVTLVAIGCLNFPYRLLIYWNLYDAVAWNKAHCNVIGERGDAVLLFCPELPVPHNRIVKRSDPGLVPLATQERLFGQYSSQNPSAH
jgi:predicted Ser/Thr protein kinase